MEALVYTKAYKLQWIYEKIFLIKKEIFFLPILFAQKRTLFSFNKLIIKRFLFEEPLPFKILILFFDYFEPFFSNILYDCKYGELHLLSKLLQVASVGQSTLTRFYSLHTFVVTCHLDTSLQLRSIFIQISLYTPILLAKLAKGMGHNYYGEPAWPNDLLYIFPVVILGTIAGTSFPYFKYSVFFYYFQVNLPRYLKSILL
ncbi:hypothetical protein ACJX0J_001989 [Zea mays]